MSCSNHDTYLSHELLENFLLLHLITCWKAHLLLALVKLHSNQNFSYLSTNMYSDAHQAVYPTIIFSTVCLVSGSKSESLLLSGSTFWVSTSGSPLITDFHHSIWLCLVSNMFRDFPSSVRCIIRKTMSMRGSGWK